MKSEIILTPKLEKISCSRCSITELCLSTNLSLDEMSYFEDAVKKQMNYSRKEIIYKQDECFSGLYIIRSGTVKTVHFAANGNKQITGFYFCGDILGLSAIHLKYHQEFAIALENVFVCQVHFDTFTSILPKLPKVQQKILSVMSEKISFECLRYYQYSAETRLCQFLLNLYNRNTKNNSSSEEVFLQMTQQDIASYLRLTPETVSRIFANLQSRDIIFLEKNAFKILSKSDLQMICNSS